MPDSSFNFDFIIQAFVKPNKSKNEEVKDTTNNPPEIKIGMLELENIYVLFDDKVTGVFSKSTIGNLTLSLDQLQLSPITIAINEFKLSNTNSVFELRNPSVAPADSVSSILPILDVKSIELNQVQFTFNKPLDSASYRFTVGHFLVKPNVIDLNRQLIDIDEIELNETVIKIAQQQKSIKEDTKKVQDSSNWKVRVAEISFSNNIFVLDNTNAPRLKKGIDYNHLLAQKINIRASKLAYSNTVIEANVQQLSLAEQCGFILQSLRTNFKYDGNSAELKQLDLHTPFTKISRYAKVSQLSDIKNNIGALALNVKFSNTKIGMQDVLQFVPDLIKQPIVKQNANQSIWIDGSIIGTLNNILLTNLIVRTATQTTLALSGTIKNLPDAQNTAVDIRLQSLITGNKDVNALLPKTMLPSVVRIPNALVVTGKVKGTLTNMLAQLKGITSDGDFTTDAVYKVEKKVPIYAVQLTTEQLNIGNILQQSKSIGTITATIDIKGTSFNKQQMKTTASARISKVRILDYEYSNIDMEANIDSGLFKTTLVINDPQLKLNSVSNGSLQPENSFIQFDLNVIGANLKALKFSPHAIKTSGAISANFQNFDIEKMSGNIGIGNVIIIKNDRKYILDSLVAFGINQKRKASLTIKNAIINIDYKGQTSLHKVALVLSNYIKEYSGMPSATVDTVEESFVCAININPNPILNEVFFPSLTQFKGLAINVDFNNKIKKLLLTANAPTIQYGANIIQQFSFKVDGSASGLTYQVGVLSYSAGSLFVPKTLLQGNIEQQKIIYNLSVIDPDSGNRLKMNGSLNLKEPHHTIFSIDGGSIVLNNQTWNISKENSIQFGKDGIHIYQFNVTNQNSFIKINSTSAVPNSPIDIQFSQFQLGTLSQIVEQKIPIVRGLLNGKMRIETINSFAFTADVFIKDIVYQSYPIGNLDIKANNLTASTYKAQIKLSGNNTDATINGSYRKDQIDFFLNIRSINLKAIEAFIPDMIKRSEGNITAKINITGSATKPQFVGSLSFQKASFNLGIINNRLALNDETIRIDNNGLYFKQFTVRDSLNQPLKINGALYTSDFKKMQFELDITTQQFRVLNTTAKNNKIYYGTIILNSTIKVRGNSDLPIVNADATLVDGSNFTFVVQQGQLGTDKGDGVVIFEDTISQNVFMRVDTVQQVSTFKGIDFNANVQINKSVNFKVIIDQESGDNLQVSGDAAFNFGIDPSGKTSLSGLYTLNSGSYKASFRKLVKRQFNIQPGSTILWSGDPLNAQIDITATYKTKAASTDLLVQELAGKTPSERNAYRKLLNYDVNLAMKGALLKPELRFGLDMPIRDKNNNPEQYAKIVQINADENELNKQVFSLLVLGKFLPTGQSNGPSTSEAVSGVARNSVNQLLSDQLNSVSGKYIKGAELNFDLQSTNEFNERGSQQQTELQVGLKKELFNSRMSVQVGSSVDVDGNSTQQSNSQNLTGDVVVEYKITDDGRYRFKAFRENQFEGIIDGMLYKTGIGILYSRDFDLFSELLSSPKKEEEIELKEAMDEK